MKMRDMLEALLDGGLLAWVLLLILLALLLGCATTCDPVIVKVPVETPSPALPLADLPEWRTPGADPSVPSTYLQALVHDLLEAWRVIAEDRHTIEAYNATMASDPAPP